MEDNLLKLKVKIKKFVEERNWEEFHNPKNLAMSIAIESGELMEIFQWMSIENSKNIVDRDIKENIEDEIADVIIYSLSLCNQLDINPYEIINNKIKKNAIKYPIKNSSL